ncbi:bZIP transcription factor 44 [Alnus glutinosa]|uniref:bZIP transcription factor 44 n=1 Tax=Alnus glutinosa TaxID=3517 RepID=UPI002D76871C|nr:bZIP transcription factor 44 [Alnus glutinosa]
MALYEEPVEFQFPVFEETGFATDELRELLSLDLIQSGDSVSVCPTSGSEGSSRAVYTDNEKKLRRMKSNRESARRSRWRKKRYLEDLKDQVNRFRTENDELKNQLGSAFHHCHVVRMHNELLRSESIALRARLSDLSMIISFTMQSQ